MDPSSDKSDKSEPLAPPPSEPSQSVKPANDTADEPNAEASAKSDAEVNVDPPAPVASSGANRKVLLSTIALGCFTLGAAVSAALTLSPQFSFNRGEAASVTNSVANIETLSQNLPFMRGDAGLAAARMASFGAIAQTVGTQGDRKSVV